ncbi:methyltransferase domain-containing protein [Teichococcus aestuarii]
MGEIFERVMPAAPLEWTGERLTTATSGQVEIEHLHRYFLARSLCRGLDVLDVAAGEGYGSALLAQAARSVLGVELSAQAVEHAARAYPAANLRYQQGDARRLPAADASVDAVVSFETLEHFYEHDQFMAEVRRVLRPGGRLIISSPERDVYSPPGSAANPYHVNELSRPEFEALLRRFFPRVHLLAQRPMMGSALVADDGTGPARTLTFEKRGPAHYEASGALPRPPYLIAVASDSAVDDVPNSLFIETSEIQGLVQASTLPPVGEIPEATRRELAAYATQAAIYEENARNNVATIARLQDELSAAREEIGLLHGQAEGLQGEMERLRRQHAALRQAFRRRPPRGAVPAGNTGATEAEMAELERLRLEAAERARQDAQEAEMRAQRIARLHRLGVLHLARLVPRPLRHRLRDRLVGQGRP